MLRRNSSSCVEFRRGVVESRLGSLVALVDRREVAPKALARIESLRSWERRRVLPVGSYRVFASAAEVPDGVWRNPGLVVERFGAEREGSDYCCRHWLFFGDREVHRRTVSADPIVKARARLEPLDEPVPARLREYREALGFDYGKFDYGLVDGDVVLYDANRTPGATSDPRRHADTVDVLSRGIASFL